MEENITIYFVGLKVVEWALALKMFIAFFEELEGIDKMYLVSNIVQFTHLLWRYVLNCICGNPDLLLSRLN